MSDAWMSGSPASRYGGAFLSSRVDPAASAAGMTSAATPPASNAHRPMHPDSALFWVGVLVVVATGLGGVATTVRLGGARAGVALGKA